MDDQVLIITHFILKKLDRLGSDVVGELIEVFVLVHLVDAKNEVQVELYRNLRVS